MIYFFIISVTINIISLSKLYLDGPIKNKLNKLTSEHNTLKTEYKKLQTEHKQLKKQLEASYKTNYKEMMKIYLELKKQGFNDNYIYNYICNKPDAF